MHLPMVYSTSLNAERRADKVRALGAGLGMVALVALIVVAIKTNPEPEEYVQHVRTALEEQHSIVGPALSWLIDADDVSDGRTNLGVCAVVRVDDFVFVGAFGKVWRLR